MRRGVSYKIGALATLCVLCYFVFGVYVDLSYSTRTDSPSRLADLSPLSVVHPDTQWEAMRRELTAHERGGAGPSGKGLPSAAFHHRSPLTNVPLREDRSRRSGQGFADRAGHQWPVIGDGQSQGLGPLEGPAANDNDLQYLPKQGQGQQWYRDTAEGQDGGQNLNSFDKKPIVADRVPEGLLGGQVRGHHRSNNEEAAYKDGSMHPVRRGIHPQEVREDDTQGGEAAYQGAADVQGHHKDQGLGRNRKWTNDWGGEKLGDPPSYQAQQGKPGLLEQQLEESIDNARLHINTSEPGGEGLKAGVGQMPWQPGRMHGDDGDRLGRHDGGGAGNVNALDAEDNGDEDDDKSSKVIKNSWENNFMYDGFQEDEIGVRLPHGHPRMSFPRGSVWPQPHTYQSRAVVYPVHTEAFRFVYPSGGEGGAQACPLLAKAFHRYEEIIRRKVDLFRDPSESVPPEQLGEDGLPKYHVKGVAPLRELEVHVGWCPFGDTQAIPAQDMDEFYTIRLDRKAKRIQSREVWGALRALETFSQLLWWDPANGGSVVVNSTRIEDLPRFSHRGVMLDTSRHFISVTGIHRLLVAMSYNKLNVFHWHIVDDHSFPLELRTFPSLHKKGAFSANLTYSAQDVKYVIHRAAELGIRVIPELDTPGHVRSWGLSYPHLIANCSDNHYPYGPLDPLKDSTYSFMDALYKEIVSLFPDSHIHIGGDECDYQCWYRNKDIRQYMLDHNMTIIGESFDGETVYKLDGAALHGVFTRRLVQEILPKSKKKIAWEEVHATAVTSNLDRRAVIINVWKGGGGEFSYVLDQVLETGFDAIVSSCWYLNYISYGKDWHKYYTCDPEGSEQYSVNNNWGEQSERDHYKEGNPPKSSTTRSVPKGKVLGAEVCIWTEFIDETNLEPILWPRALAAAERFWSPKDVGFTTDTEERFDIQHCRLRRRGINSSPNSGPGTCEGEFRPKYPI